MYNNLNKYFSPLQVKNKPCEGVTTPAFILGPVSMVGKNYWETLSIVKTWTQSCISVVRTWT